MLWGLCFGKKDTIFNRVVIMGITFKKKVLEVELPMLDQENLKLAIGVGDSPGEVTNIIQNDLLPEGMSVPAVVIGLKDRYDVVDNAVKKMIAKIKSINSKGSFYPIGSSFVSPGPSHKGKQCILTGSYIALTTNYIPYLLIVGAVVKADGTPGGLMCKLRLNLVTMGPVMSALQNDMRVA